MLKRLDGAEAEQFQQFIGDEDDIYLVDGTPYQISRLPELNELGLEIESDPELKASLQRAEEDIKAGRVYSTQEAIKMLERGDFD